MGEKKLKNIIEREPRQTTYLVVRIRRSKIFPFLATDAQLIDLSSKGMKLKVANPLEAEEGKVLWIDVPLAHPASHQSMRMPAEVRWYDEEKLFLGVELPNLDSSQQELLDHHIEVFRKLGRIQV